MCRTFLHVFLVQWLQKYEDLTILVISRPNSYIINSHIFYPRCARPVRVFITEGLFTWREGAPANRATRLEGLAHCPPLHATHLTGTVSGLRGAQTKWPTKETLFSSLFSFLHWHGPVLCVRLIYYIDLFRMTVIVRQITLANGNHEKIHLAPPCFRGLSRLG